MLRDAAEPASATLLLAHGAGAPMDSSFLQSIATGLCVRGISVVRFEFPYMAERRRTGRRAPPNRMPVLEASFREAIDKLVGTPNLFIGGKSMGGRVATLIADSTVCGVRGVVVLGYPFHPPRRADKLRVEHLRTLETPCLIVQGSRDALGSRDEVATYQLARRTRVHWVEDGDHSLEPRRSSGRTTTQSWDEAVRTIATFVHKRVRP